MCIMVCKFHHPIGVVSMSNGCWALDKGTPYPLPQLLVLLREGLHGHRVCKLKGSHSVLCRFAFFHGSTHPMEMGATEVEAVLVRYSGFMQRGVASFHAPLSDEEYRRHGGE